MSDIITLSKGFSELSGKSSVNDSVFDSDRSSLHSSVARTSSFMQQPIFNTHKSETQLMRYMQLLAGKDVGLTKSMIPLGSCTMKLNPAVTMIPVSWPEFGGIHPFAPRE